MTTESDHPLQSYGDNSQQEPLIISSNQNTNHNDPELMNQRTVINLNNRNVRLTIWCIVYMILALNAYHGGFAGSVYWNDDTDTEWTDSIYEKRARYWEMYLSANALLFWGAAIFLCTLYCPFCQCKCNIFCCILFIAATIMQCVAVANGVEAECKDFPVSMNHWKDYCKVYYVGSQIYVILFTIYLIFDILKSFGDDIKIRVCIKAICAAIQSFVLFSWWNWALQEELDEDEDWQENAFLYTYRVVSGGFMAVGIVCCIIILLIAFGAKMNYYIPKVLAFFLISGIASAIIWPWFAFTYLGHQGGIATYYLAAVLLLIYDIQYL